MSAHLLFLVGWMGGIISGLAIAHGARWVLLGVSLAGGSAGYLVALHGGLL